MKSVKWLALLFLLNNEVVSWLTLAVLVIAGVAWFMGEVYRETGGNGT